MKRAIHLAAALALVAAMGVGMFGCHTLRGMGRDIQRGGEAIEDAASGAQK